MKLRIAILCLICAGLLGVTLAASAAPQAGYTMDWWSADGGGGASSGGGYSLTGTLGQPDAGHLSAAGYSLLGGYWGAANSGYKVFLPAVRR
jgi:hypothetical protein